MMKRIFRFILDPKNTRMFLLAGIMILVFMVISQHNKNEESKREITRLNNNAVALQDTILNYINERGEWSAKIRALNLNLSELADSLIYEKNKPPITIVRYQAVVVEKIVEVPVYIYETDTVYQGFNSFIVAESSDSWGKSSRNILVKVPFSMDETGIVTSNASIDLEQNIWLSASLNRDKKTDEIFVNLHTDYPGTTFNNAQGVLVNHRSSFFKDLEYKERKSLGLGLQLGVGLAGSSISPYVGVGVSYTPKFLQW